MDDESRSKNSEKPSKRRLDLKFLRTKKGKLVIAVVVVLLVAIAATTGFIYYNYKTQTAIIVDGKRITKAEYNSLLKEAKDNFATDDEAKEVIVRSQIGEDITKEFNLPVNDHLLNERSLAMFNQEWLALGDWQKQKIYTDTLVDLSYFLSKGGYNIYQYNAPFSINYGMYGDNPLKSPAEIETARIAAENKANEVRSQLVQDKSKADALVNDLRTNEPYRTGYGFATNQSKQFYVTEDGFSFISGRADRNQVSVREKTMETIKALKNGEVSGVVTESANLTTLATKEDNPYFKKVIPISYQVFYVKDKITAQPGLYEKVMNKLNSVKVEE